MRVQDVQGHGGLPPTLLRACKALSHPAASILSHPIRAGFLSHAGILTVTSHPINTSPVLRGKWVLNELLPINILWSSRRP